MAESREQWLEWRRNFIGASDVPRILLGHFGGPHAVWREKLGLDKSEESTEGQELGLRLEWVIVDMAIEKLGWARPTKRTFQRRYERGHFAATVDAVLYYPDGPRILECKTTGRVGDEAKDSWRLQSQMQMYCSGVRRHAVAALGGGFGGLSFRVWEQQYDEELVNLVLPQLDAFWELVQSKKPPAWDGSDSADETLRAAYSASGGEREPNDEEKELLRKYGEALTAASAAKKLKQEVMGALGNDTAFVGYCTYKEQKGRTTVDSKKLQAEFPDVYGKVSRTGEPVRVFRWKGGSDE